MMRTVLLFVLLSSILLSGCTQTTIPEPAQAPLPESTPTSSKSTGEWTVTMTHSGGIMGLSRSIEVSSDGRFLVTDNRTNKSTTGELTADDLSKLDNLLTSIDNRSAGKPGGMVCADCFVYDLEIQGGAEKIAVQLNDISLSGSGYEPLVTQLRGLIDAALK